MIRIGIVSFAHIHAYSYARALKELEREGLARLEAVFDDNHERLRSVSEIYRPPKVYGEFDELVEDKEIDGVIVASENSRHAEYTIPLLRSGKHVLVEKPIATRYRDAVAMISEARSRGLHLLVAFVMRYHDASREIKRRIRDLGRIYAITSTNHGKNPMDWFVDPEKAGGGAMMDHIVHAADLIRWFTEKEFEEAVAFVGRNIRRDISVEDNAIIMARLSDGAIVSIDCSWSRPPAWPVWGDLYMRIVGERGVLVLNAFNQNISVADDKIFKGIYYGPDADKNMIEAFTKIISGRIDPVEIGAATGEDGLRALELVLAAYRSWREKRVVRISEIRE